MVAAAGAGPPPIDRKMLTADSFAQAIGFCLTPSARHAASSIAAMMKSEEGVKNAAASFHQNVPWNDMQCNLLSSETAVWSLNGGKMKVSHKALAILSQFEKIDMQQMKRYVYHTKLLYHD
jgi:sterol 3beta-glucosyltransferase